MRFLGKLTVAFFSLVLTTCVFVVTSIYIISMDLPSVDGLQDYTPPESSRIMSKNGEVLLEVGKENRDLIPLEEIPKVLTNAFIAAEDENFYQHKGIDPQGILRALIADIRAGGFVQGGSTITQQVAKLLLLSREKSFTRKIKDFLLAIEIEKKFSKDQILYFYLNHIYLGSGYYGVKAAARGYFNKDIREIDPSEAALIAGLNVAPTKYSPYRNAKFSKIRQLYVLGRMREIGFLDEETFQREKSRRVLIQIDKNVDFKGGHFTDWVRQRVVGLVGEENFLSGGYTVKTTMDYELQKVAEKEVVKGLKEIDKRQGYRGPLKKLNLEDQAQNFLQDIRKKYLHQRSSFFFIDENGQVEYEFPYSDDEFAGLFARHFNYLSISPDIKVIPGIKQEDVLLRSLENSDSLEGLVIEVSDKLNLVFVSVGGTPGVITFDNLEWAKPVSLSESPQYLPLPKKPSDVLKAGDVILVRIENITPKPLNEFIKKELKLKLNINSKEILQQNLYLSLGLDQVPEVEGALISLEMTNNEILAVVGGRDFKTSQFNRALQSIRQPGSSFKPFIFAAALEEGYTSASILNDTPESLGGVEHGLDWKPRNYDGKFKGPITLRQVLQESRNVPTVKLAADLGLEKISTFIKRIGLNPSRELDLSVSLGSVGFRLLDLTSSYSVFVHQGKRIRPKSILSILDREGKEVDFHSIETIPAQMMDPSWPDYVPAEDFITDEQREQNPFLKDLSGDQVYDPRLSYIMTSILRGVVEEGTGAQIGGLSPFIAGKTGTTNGYNDAVFIGFSSNIITGVWTGFDNNKTLGFGETGAKAAMPIWAAFMDLGLKKYGEGPFVMPEGVVQISVDKRNGRLATSSSEEVFSEFFVDGTQPGAEESTKINLPTSGNKDAAAYEDEDYFNQQ